MNVTAKSVKIAALILLCIAALLPIVVSNANAATTYVTLRIKYTSKWNLLAQTENSANGWVNQGGGIYCLSFYPNGSLLDHAAYTTSPYKYGKYTYTQVDSTDGGLRGQCVDFIKALSMRQDVPTRGNTYNRWKKGDKVMTSTAIALGTAIATFDGTGQYYGHCAFFAGWDSGKTGFKVYDQNWGPLYNRVNGGGVVGKHFIYKTGLTFVSNANNYYIVEVPAN